MSKKKHASEFCETLQDDPICASEGCDCGKPIRLCCNWTEEVTPTGIVFEKRKRLTKAQQKAFAAVSKLMATGPISPFIPVTGSPRERKRLRELKRAGKPLMSLSRKDFLHAAISEGAFGFPGK